MEMAPRNQGNESHISTLPRFRLPWALAAVVLVAIFAVGYSLDSDRSLSERNGVVSQTEAENGVIPSIPPQ